MNLQSIHEQYSQVLLMNHYIKADTILHFTGLEIKGDYPPARHTELHAVNPVNTGWCILHDLRVCRQAMAMFRHVADNADFRIVDHIALIVFYGQLPAMDLV